ncbi:hypothetical protein TcWFU_004599 [Taenia crassiceps]|uniref:Uncharacterized protein n=1 Tax=Taenia crassiceps TaxID=6207 RepID=A0ABR4QDR4_9CEST
MLKDVPPMWRKLPSPRIPATITTISSRSFRQHYPPHLPGNASLAYFWNCNLCLRHSCIVVQAIRKRRIESCPPGAREENYPMGFFKDS